MGKAVKELEDVTLVKRVKRRRCNDSLKELIGRHSPLCFDIYKKYFLVFVGCLFEIQEIYFKLQSFFVLKFLKRDMIGNYTLTRSF